ncbi:MAG: YdcH family protein [Gammaproteobacteria bacterium]|nr:YdcH family protein [Gammaproteobacteria bacterium]
MKDKIDTEAFKDIEQLKKLRVDHRNLDDVIARMAHDPTMDQLQIKRMKKERLKLKDQITRIESELIPDLNA